MAATAQTPFFKSWVEIGGVMYPAYPGSLRMICPVGYVVPPIIANYWQWTYGVGLRVPVMEAQLCVQDIAASCFSTTFLNFFMTRSGDAAFDTPAIAGGIRMWNGRRGFKMVTGVKADSFTLGSSAGEPLRFTVRFTGTDYAAFSGGEATAAPGLLPNWTRDNMLTFSAVTWGGPLDDAVWNWNLSYSNQHTPDLSHNGTPFATAQNAGSPSAGLSLLVQAATLPEIVLPNGNGSFPPPVTPSTLQVVTAGAVVNRTWTLSNPVIQNPQDVVVQAPRNMNEFNLMCLGGDGNTIGPLVIT